MNKVKERPISFSGPMVRAILDGRKTQTRRVIKTSLNLEIVPRGELVRLCDYGHNGDRLWVRETWATEKRMDTQKPSFLDYSGDAPLWYKADYSPSTRAVGDKWDYVERGKWRPSIFIPRWASRITLEITEVRVQRVQDISEEDAVAEGTPINDFLPINTARIAGVDTRTYFAELWNKINGKGAWESNPWVWAISFKVVK